MLFPLSPLLLGMPRPVESRTTEAVDPFRGAVAEAVVASGTLWTPLSSLSGYRNDGEYVLSRVAEQTFDSFLFSFLGVSYSIVDKCRHRKGRRGKKAFARKGRKPSCG